MHDGKLFARNVRDQVARYHYNNILASPFTDLFFTACNQLLPAFSVCYLILKISFFPIFSDFMRASLTIIHACCASAMQYNVE